MIVYRLSKERFKNDISGKGAELAGGRWNSKGLPLLYTSASRALCTVEIAVHIPLGIIPKDFYLASIEFPDSTKIFSLSKNDLPKDWKSFPYPASTQAIGNKFIKEGKYLVMKVPSAVVERDVNYLVNPQHKEFKKVKVVRTLLFAFDERLFN